MSGIRCILGWSVWFVLGFSLVEVQAITWEFDREGDRQGWQAREGFRVALRSLLHSEVQNGIWRIFPAPFEEDRIPSVELISPRIGHDSALFDRVIVRLRVVRPQPLETHLALLWTNPLNRTTPGWEPEILGGSSTGRPSRFSFYQQVILTGEWQEVVFGRLYAGAERVWNGEPQTLSWEGELIDIRLSMVLAELSEGGAPIEGAEEEVEALEIDRIVLTGVEEQLEGELPPPSSRTAVFGELFSDASFQGLGKRGIGDTFGFFLYRGGSLGDLDGDGDLDLAVLWMGTQIEGGRPVSTSGWLTALNEGKGVFEADYAEDLPGSLIPFVDGADLDGDGDMDLMVRREGALTLLYSEGEAGWVEGKKVEGMSPMGLSDADGDGDVDLWVADYQGVEAEGIVFLNDGKGGFNQEVRLRLSPLPEGSGPLGLIEAPGGRPVGALLGYLSFDAPEQGYGVRYWDERGEVVQQHLATAIDLVRIHYAGDFDQDGDVDLVVGNERMVDGTGQDLGLSFLVDEREGELEEVPWLEEVQVKGRVSFFDLNGDGCLDPVLVDRNVRGPAVVVGLGRVSGLPVVEGRYPIGGSGGPILSGDVDGDGDLDLVVLEPAYEGGGVFVLLNRLHDGVTAVEEGVAALPVHFRLGANYPNPFNPQTWISFEIPADGDFVDLRIYNVLGQPIRTLVIGRLGAGYHLVPWDGRDSQGQAVSAGVYLYRLHASDRQIIRKMLKIE